MLTISIPYKTGFPKQIPLKYIISNNFKIEANIFDVNQLITKKAIQKLTEEIFSLQLVSKNRVGSLHFPTDNADYFIDFKKYQALINAIDICSRTGIPIIVLHSNIIIPLKLYSKDKIKSIRRKYISLIKNLDLYITNKNINVSICIENMPIIGNNGNDFDSIFIFPEDFSFIKELKNIAVTLDISHWGFTCEFIKSVNNIHPYISINKHVRFNDMTKISNLIKHLHLSSFKLLTFPNTDIDCMEGLLPSKGFLLEEEIINVLNTIQSDGQNRSIVLEIKEDNYSKRVNFFKTVNWLKKTIPNLLTK
jgi:endonuclease IV